MRTLLAIADRGSFGAAAEATHVTQSAVSMQMRTLEDEIGIAIFDRTKRPPVLNAYGRRLVERARQIVLLYDRMVDATSDAHDLSGTLTLGAVPTCFMGLVPKALAAVRINDPRLKINVVTDYSAQLIARLQRGDVDAAVLTRPAHQIDGVSWRPIVSEPLVVVAPDEARRMDAREILTSFPYIRFNRHAWVGKIIETSLRHHDVAVKVAMELDSLEAISIMVYHGLGASVVPLPCVAPPSPLPLRYLPFGGPDDQRSLVLAEPASNPRGHLTAAVYSELVRVSGGERRG